MTMDLERKEIRVNNNIQEDKIQNIVEGDIIVPDSKPDVMTIIQTSAEIKINSKETHKDLAVIRGTVTFKILYISDDPSRYICSISNDVNFDQTVDIKSEGANVKSLISYDVEHIEGNILNGRKLNVKAVLNCNVKITKEITSYAVSDLYGAEGVQTLTEPILISKEEEAEEAISIVSWESEISIGKPAIKDVLKTEVIVKDKDVKITGGKAIIKGNLDVRTIYTPDMNEGLVEISSAQVPFSEVVDCMDAEDADYVNVLMNIENVATEIKNDQDGDTRILDYSITMKFKPVYTKKTEMEIVTDAYSVLSELELERNSIKINKQVDKTKAQTSIKDIIEIDSKKPLIRQIYVIKSRPVITNVSNENDNIAFEGIIELSGLYLSDSEEVPLVDFNSEIPFHYSSDVKAYPEAKINVTLENFDFSYEKVNDKAIEIKGILISSINVSKEDNINVISNIQELPLDEKTKQNQPSMTVYYVQVGDTLWDIAKKYYTTTKELMTINNLNNIGTLQVGQQLLIPRIG